MPIYWRDYFLSHWFRTIMKIRKVREKSEWFKVGKQEGPHASWETSTSASIFLLWEVYFKFPCLEKCLIFKLEAMPKCFKKCSVKEFILCANEEDCFLILMYCTHFLTAGCVTSIPVIVATSTFWNPTTMEVNTSTGESGDPTPRLSKSNLSDASSNKRPRRSCHLPLPC